MDKLKTERHWRMIIADLRKRRQRREEAIAKHRRAVAVLHNGNEADFVALAAMCKQEAGLPALSTMSFDDLVRLFERQQSSLVLFP